MVKKGPLKRSDYLRNLIVAFSISLFILQIKSFNPGKIIFKIFSFFRDGFGWIC